MFNFVFYNKCFTLMINFYISKHVALNAVYLVVLTVSLHNHYMIVQGVV